jgi:hypothetical protein
MCCSGYSQGFCRNLFHIFLSLIIFSTYFRSSYEFMEFLKENGKRKNPGTMLALLLGLRPGTVHLAQWPRWPTTPSPRCINARRARSLRGARARNGAGVSSPTTH